METPRLTALLAGRAAAASVNGAMPTFEGLEFRYALHPLPPGRLPFRRWRWELWHGPRMLAAGWRVTERDAGRAICKYAATYAHRLFGLPEPAGAGVGHLPARAQGARAGGGVGSRHLGEARQGVVVASNGRNTAPQDPQGGTPCIASSSP